MIFEDVVKPCIWCQAIIEIEINIDFSPIYLEW